jgi:two-component system response regulator YesN
MIVAGHETTKQQSVMKYPVQIEKISVDSFVKKDYKELEQSGEQFIISCIEKNYSPFLIKKCVIRYLLALLQVVKEFNFTIYDTIGEAKILESINLVYTQEELKKTTATLIKNMIPAETAPVNHHVEKAKRYVEEYYHTGINLEEISRKMGLTPEYISTCFLKELGITFSTYIRSFRINKAKELLISTNLKIYEISDLVGYGDVKYFSKLFRESENVLPVEYRKNHQVI